MPTVSPGCRVPQSIELSVCVHALSLKTPIPTALIVPTLWTVTTMLRMIAAAIITTIAKAAARIFSLVVAILIENCYRKVFYKRIIEQFFKCREINYFW